MNQNQLSQERTVVTELLTRLRLASLWVSLMFLYLYADFFSLYRPGIIESIDAGNMGPFTVSQQSLLIASILMLIPCPMCAVSFLLSHTPTRWLHISFAVLYTVVNVGNLIGETWLYYLFYGAVECLLTISIVVLAWRWR